MLLTQVLPALRALVEINYFSLTVEGAEHVPRRGPAVYVGNHAGWITLDTLMGALAIVDHVGADRLPYGAVQDQLLKVPAVGRFFEGVGGFPASWLRDPKSLPRQMEVFSVYPEGTEGNCKPFWHAYRMRRWRTGFAHLSAALRAPIVPVAILGGEECLPVACTLRVLRPLLGTILPVPLFALPLPARWKIVFHEPVRFYDGPWSDRESAPGWAIQRARRVAESIRGTVQRTLDRETEHRLLGQLSRRLHGVDRRAEKIAGPSVYDGGFASRPSVHDGGSAGSAPKPPVGLDELPVTLRARESGASA
jgi:1-acyl-sn-glycerol-3-phosphate acyltransferase